MLCEAGGAAKVKNRAADVRSGRAGQMLMKHGTAQADRSATRRGLFRGGITYRPCLRSQSQNPLVLTTSMLQRNAASTAAPTFARSRSLRSSSSRIQTR